jgi:hypothetical protein
MKVKRFLDLVDTNFRERLEIYHKKVHDYATEDCLSNFKRLASMTKELGIDSSTPRGVCLFFILVKLDRMCNLLKKGTSPRNESLNDTINDLQNYADILRGVLEETI